ncbi:MAG: hypothetical protein HC838_08250, partial [Spirulinaceae cyanobacterium RM2_2_10]|nr:hypothetical protein [Spirulinaceae cyanobacterium RM2_2_10]
MQPLPLPGTTPLGETVQRQPLSSFNASSSLISPTASQPVVQRDVASGGDRPVTAPNLQRQATAPAASGTTADVSGQAGMVQRSPIPSTTTDPSATPSIQRQDATSSSTPNVAASPITTPSIQRQADTTTPSASTPSIQRQ